MRSGGFRERVIYWERLVWCMNRPAYFEYKLAAVLDRLPTPTAADIAKYDNVPRPMLYFQSPEVCAALDVFVREEGETMSNELPDAVEVAPDEAAMNITTCPKCTTELEGGFGLAGGGYGPYLFCPADDCDFFRKKQLGADEE